MLLDKISFWQRLLERAIGTRPTGSAKTNRLVQICLYAVVQESFDLYKDISDGLALLLDSFFHLQYHSCVIAFQTCVKASKQFEELSAFYSLCKSIGVGRTSEYPSVQNISEELIETLQEFLKDQSSFPVRSPARALALPAGLSSGRDFTYDGSEYSYSESSTGRYSEGVTEYGSQSTSLEDLISATESGRNLHNISIDLEDYSDQFEKKSQRDDTFRVSDTGSTHSLPVSNSMVDLVSLDDWPANEEQATTTTDFGATFPANTDIFSSAPTFQATPTFSAQNQNHTSGLQNENDPFGAFGSEQLLNGSMNQQILLQEQQLWLQQQNKIIAKHMN
ncbi:hypothetical protein LguiA_035297 [Lonicera macranthoides]